MILPHKLTFVQIKTFNIFNLKSCFNIFAPLLYYIPSNFIVLAS